MEEERGRTETILLARTLEGTGGVRVSHQCTVYDKTPPTQAKTKNYQSCKLGKK